MSNDGYVAPVNHGIVTTTASAVAGFIGGGFKGGIIWSAVLGAVPLVAAAIAVPFVGPLVGALAIGAGVVASAFGVVAGGGLGTIIGAWTGGGRAIEQVKREQGLANQMQAEVNVFKAQAMTQSRPSTAAIPNRVNAAPSVIQAGNDNLQYDGRMTGVQLAASR